MAPDKIASRLASQVAALLAEHEHRLVLAESCTAGLISATLAEVPGISSLFCGSCVVYRDRTKIQWLGVDPTMLQRWSAESQQATSAIAQGVLQRTAEATLALGITGHLGPDAPADQDGRIFLAVWARESGRLTEVAAVQEELVTTARVERQREAVTQALSLLKHCLE